MLGIRSFVSNIVQAQTVLSQQTRVCIFIQEFRLLQFSKKKPFSLLYINNLVAN